MNVKKTVLDNRLTILTETLDHVRSIAIGVWIKSGSRQEPTEQNGISHLIEHMLFKGTENRTAQEIAIAIDSIGGQMDAFTTREYVGFYLKVLDEHLDTALELLSDIVLKPTFPDDELEKERNVVFEEINMTEDSPQELVYELFTERFWKNHPLGRPISGTKKSVKTLKREHLIHYFRQCYTAENMIIAAAGNLKHGIFVDLIRKHFQRLHTQKAGRKEYPPRPASHLFKRNKNELEQVHICLGTISPSLTSDRRYPVHALNNILGGGLSSRLFQNIREKRGLVYSIFSGLSLYRDAGCLTVYAGTGLQAAPLTVDLIMEELKNVREGGIEEQELNRCKDNIKGAMVLSLESTSSRMSSLAQQEIYFGRHISLNEIIKRIDAVTLSEVNAVAAEIFDNKYLSMTILGNLNGLTISKNRLSL